MPDLERRAGMRSEMRAVTEADGTHVRWMPIIYRQKSQNLGGFREIIAGPEALRKTLASSRTVLALENHDVNRLLGSTVSGTLKLRNEQDGLHADVLLPDTSAGRDVLTLVQRGDLNGGSFGFSVPKGADTWTQDGALALRTVNELELVDVTLTSSPAYLQTVGLVTARSLFAAAFEAVEAARPAPALTMAERRAELERLNPDYRDRRGLGRERDDRPRETPRFYLFGGNGQW